MSAFPESAFERLFATSPAPHVLLTPDLVICGVNDAYLRATGRDRGRLVGMNLFDAFPDDVHHDDNAARLRASFARTLASREPDVLPAQRYDVAPDDTSPGPVQERWWSLVTSPVFDEAGVISHLLHRVEDITDLAAPAPGSPPASAVELYARGRELQELNEQLRASQAETARVLESMAVGYIALNERFEVTFINSEGERFIERTRQELVGASLWDSFDGLEELAFGQCYHRVMSSRVPESLEAFYPALELWFEVRVVPEPGGIGLYFLDITARVTAQQSVQRNSDRLALLASVSEVLAATLDVDTAMRALAETVVPQLADWCVITVVDGQDMRDVAAVHHDPAMQADVDAYVASQPASMSSAAPIRHVLSTGEPVIAPAIRDEVVEAVFPDPGVRALLARLRPSAGIAIPIRTPEHTLGVLALWHGPDRPPHTEEDIQAALEIGRRAGLLIENATLYAGQFALAEALQRSLLTAPPQPDHIHISTRYQPAAQQAQVGGDWYDAFMTRDGATVLAIGDVIGHDFVAAAVMGQVRGLLRGIGYATGAAPASLLAQLDEAIDGLMVNTIASAIVARLEQTESEKGSGRRVLRWSNAGHPPPVVLDEDGVVHVLDGAEPDLLLGLGMHALRHESVMTLRPGSLVLLFTDGLIERRGLSLDDGLSQLTSALRELRGMALEPLLDELLRRLLPGEQEDDVAIVAVRLYREDQLRPQEAGPLLLPVTIEAGEE